MGKLSHGFFVGIMAAIVVITTSFIIFYGFDYYNTPLEDRFYNESHSMFKPSGPIGHGLGIAGSLFMFIGVGSYMLRKNWRRISHLGQLRYWLEFHIFMCTLGPILVLFHTAFKFGGIVSISFWSMVAVFLSGIIGRYIYIQIPRTIEGRELSLSEIRNTKTDTISVIKEKFGISDNILADINKVTTSINTNSKGISLYIFENIAISKRLKRILATTNLVKKQRRQILVLVKNEVKLNRRIARLNLMKNLFKYWHVAHLPFALVMLVILLIHVGITIAFGYRWIF